MKPVLAHLKGRGFAQLEQINATLKSPIDKPNGRSQFLKAHLINGEVEILDRQSSSMLKSFSESNAIAFLPANEKRAAGSSILIYKLPN
jgi:molybdopterin molybdotransferase